MRRHCFILLILTVIVRGGMMVSYPLGGAGDDNQTAQIYLIDELLNGNFQIGNLRYQTGYPFMIAPVVALARLVERFDDRLVLLFQSGVSALIPFLIYDIVRRTANSRHAETSALIVALVVLLDPFGLQWAHFWLPEWGIAFWLVVDLWVIIRSGASLRACAGAGLAIGIACLMRLNMLPVAAALGLLLLAFSASSLRLRAQRLIVFVAACGGIVALYLLLIQYPSTGTLRPSCISGISLLESLDAKGVPVAAANGANSARYLDLLTYRPTHEVLFLSDTYPRWREPDAWATAEEQRSFLNRMGNTDFATSSYTLIYYLGACAVDDLLRGVYFEGIAANPLPWVNGTLNFTMKVLTQTPVAPGKLFTDQSLPAAASLTYRPGGILGFRQAEGFFYTGQWVWTPGISLFSALYPLLNLSKWLTLPALVWALCSRKWFYITTSLLLLAAAVSISMVDYPETRIYAATYPLWTILIGGMAAAIGRKLSPS